MSGRLYICATPIGNMEDVTLRVLRVLGEVDLIAAEDTRRTRKLLTHYGIHKRLVSFFEQNERVQLPYLMKLLKSGQKVALVTDAGTPAISDPGYTLITACISEGIGLEVLPGPSAVIAALVLSGMPVARFCFEGYLPRKSSERRRALDALAGEERTIVVFETANRVGETLHLMHEIFGDRRIALLRELTKLHEQVLRGTTGRLLEELPPQIAGEIVLVVEGNRDDRLADSIGSAVELARQLVRDGNPKSKAARESAGAFKVSRRLVYQRLMQDRDGS